MQLGFTRNKLSWRSSDKTIEEINSLGIYIEYILYTLHAAFNCLLATPTHTHTHFKCSLFGRGACIFGLKIARFILGLPHKEVTVCTKTCKRATKSKTSYIFNIKLSCFLTLLNLIPFISTKRMTSPQCSLLWRPTIVNAEGIMSNGRTESARYGTMKPHNIHTELIIIQRLDN